jgi:predicted class III extradiol MEMO1 family dioxygenase
MKAESYLMSDSEFSAAVEMIVGGFEKKYNHTIVDVTDMRRYDLREYVRETDPMMPFSILDEVVNFAQNANNDAFVYILRTDSEVCGIISVQD